MGAPQTMLELSQVDHIGIRVADAARAEAFYARLGFAVDYRSAAAPVVVLKNEAGVSLHLIINADADAGNVLMDVAEKHAGFTHVALRVACVEATARALESLGIEISDGPLAIGGGTSLFVRDPDRNVIELHARR